MDEEMCLAAASAFAEALSRYLMTNARRTISIAEIVGQDNVRVSVRVLFRGHNPLYGFPRAIDALSYLINIGFSEWASKRWSWSFKEVGNGYLIIPLKWLRNYLGKDPNALILEIRGFCEELIKEKEKTG